MSQIFTLTILLAKMFKKKIYAVYNESEKAYGSELNSKNCGVY